MTLTGRAAIRFAEANDLTLSKYNDPTEGAREGLTPAEARKVAAEDPSLIYFEWRDLPVSVLARWKAEDWDDDSMTASEYAYESEDGPIDLTESEADLYAWGNTDDNITGGCQRGSLRTDC